MCFWEGVGGENNMKTCLKLAATVFEEVCGTEDFMNLCSECVKDLVTQELCHHLVTDYLLLFHDWNTVQVTAQLMSPPSVKDYHSVQ